jgi:hypothetical protein
MAVLGTAVLGGCTTTKLAQRDGCWVRHTEKFLGGSKEELGPCAGPAPTWSDDQLMRLTQECMAREDWRSQERALAAWSRGEPPPARGEETVLRACQDDALALDVAQRAPREKQAELERAARERQAEQEKTALRREAELEKAAAKREAELEKAAARREADAQAERAREALADRDAARASADQERETLRAAAKDEHEAQRARAEAEQADARQRADAERNRAAEAQARLADWLGQAANKAQQPAVATANATSEGRATTEHSATSEQSSLASAPGGAGEGEPGAVPAARTRTVRTSGKVTAKPVRKPVACAAPVSCEPATPAASPPGAQAAAAAPGPQATPMAEGTGAAPAAR